MLKQNLENDYTDMCNFTDSPDVTSHNNVLL